MTVPDIDAIMTFTSTTKNAERAFEGNVLFIIASLNGRELGPYSDKLSEEEVLFQTGLRIEVLGLEQQGGLLVINVAEFVTMKCDEQLLNSGNDPLSGGIQKSRFPEAGGE